MYFLLSGRHPFGERKNYNTAAHLAGNVSFDIEVDEYDINPFANVSDSAKEVILAMLTVNKIQRPSVDEILGLDWFKQKYEQMSTREYTILQYTDQIGIMAETEF